MKLALAAAKTIDGDLAHNLSQMEQHMKAAKAAGAELVCFGEAFLHGFDALCWRYEEDRHRAVTIASPEFQQILRMSRDIGIDVLFGYYERDGETLYSSCALVEQGKLLHNYRRISRGWKEYTKTDDHYREGESVEVFSYHGKSCAIALCGDLWDHPERFALGQELLFWPVYVGWTKEQWETTERFLYAQQAKRCCETTLFVNSLCEGDANGAAALFRQGEILQELPMGQEGLLVMTV